MCSLTYPQTKLIKRTIIACLTLGLGGFIYFSIPIRGVPIPILIKFLADQPAREAYWGGQTQVLHDRLNQLGIEEDIKAYYRPQFQDEDQLDQHIHQIFYNNTGYVGNSYEVNAEGILVPKVSQDLQFERWYRLALRAGIVADHKIEDGIRYVISPKGKIAPYPEIAAVYPNRLLHRLIKLQKSQY